MAEDAGAATEKAGIPQLDLTAFPNQLFWLVVVLVVMYLIVSRVVIPRIGGVLGQRTKTIQDDLDEAVRLDESTAGLNQETAARMAEAKSQADRIAAEARALARAEQDKAIAKATEEIAAKSDEAEARIEAIRQSARASVQEIATAAADEIVKTMMPGRDARGRVEVAVQARLNGAGN